MDSDHETVFVPTNIEYYPIIRNYVSTAKYFFYIGWSRPICRFHDMNPGTQRLFSVDASRTQPELS